MKYNFSALTVLGLMLALAVAGQKPMQGKNCKKKLKKCKKKDKTCQAAFAAECSVMTMKSEMSSFIAQLGTMITHDQCAKMIDDKIANQQRVVPKGRQMGTMPGGIEEPMPAANRTTMMDEYINSSTISDDLKEFMRGFVEIMREGRGKGRPRKEGHGKPGKG